MRRIKTIRVSQESIQAEPGAKVNGPVLVGRRAEARRIAGNDPTAYHAGLVGFSLGRGICVFYVFSVHATIVALAPEICQRLILEQSYKLLSPAGAGADLVTFPSSRFVRMIEYTGSGRYGNEILNKARGDVEVKSGNSLSSKVV